VSTTFLSPPQMFDRDEYPSVPPLQYEADWCWNRSLELTLSTERAEPEFVTIKRNALELHATEGWQLRSLNDLVRTRAFVNQRPGGRPGKSERAELEAMSPAEFLKSLFSKGLAYTACPDDLVWAGVLGYAETHYSAGDMRAARRLTEATIQCLAVRAGIEPASSEELMIDA
jgi:hypothetical protein